METGATLLCFVGEGFIDSAKLLGDRSLHANSRLAPASGAQIALSVTICRRIGPERCRPGPRWFARRKPSLGDRPSVI
jgi:hypothetical protein